MQAQEYYGNSLQG